MHAVNFARIARYINGPLKNAILALVDGDTGKAKKAIDKKLVACLNRDHAEPFVEDKDGHFEGVNTNQALLIDLHRNLSQLLDYDTVASKSKSVNARVYYGSKQGF